MNAGTAAAISARWLRFPVFGYAESLIWGIRRFAASDGPTWRQRLRFLVRCLIHPQASHLWFTYLRGTSIPAHASVFWRILQSPHRSFYDRRWRPMARARLLRSSYELLGATLGGQVVQRLVQGEKLVLAELVLKQGEIVRLCISQEPRFLREGILSLCLMSGDATIISLSYTLVDAGGVRAALIGCLQTTVDDGLNTIRHLTKALSGLQPRFLLIHALRLICAMSGVKRIEGVSNDNHIYTSGRHRRKKNVRMNYDALWESAGGARQRDGNYALPVTIAARSIEEYPSRKRAEHRRRRALLQDVEEQIGKARLISRPAH